MKRFLFSATALAGVVVASVASAATICSVSDIDLTVNSILYSPIACADAIPNGNPTQETSAINAAFSSNLSYLAKDGAASVAYQGLLFTTSTSAGNVGTWNVAWSDINGAAPLNLPTGFDFAVGLFGGSTGAAYYFDNLTLAASPNNSGTGTFEITFTNNGGNNPAISHLTLLGGDPFAVPEPASLALLGFGAVVTGAVRRRRVAG